MSSAGAPIGNKNATKNRLWRDALNKRLREYSPGEDSKVEHYWALQKIADKLIEQALEGDIQAIKEIGDRVDGKAVQAISGDPDNPVAIQRIERVIVKN